MRDIAVVSPSHYAVPADAAARPVRRADMGKLAAAAFSIALIGTMLSAVVQNFQARPRDSFPFSYFPMFTANIANLQTENYVVGRDAGGRRYPVHYNNIAPGGSLPRVRKATRDMVSRGQSAQLCQMASARIAERNPRALSSVVSLEVMTGTYNLSEYLRGNKKPKSETVLATCAVAR
jgi:hypothetical protein